MKDRCFNKNDQDYKYYGARGISVCQKWRGSFAAFVDDVGPKPTDKHTLDRIDNSGNYEPGNCRWSTSSVQNKNRRRKTVAWE